MDDKSPAVDEAKSKSVSREGEIKDLGDLNYFWEFKFPDLSREDPNVAQDWYRVEDLNVLDFMLD